MRIKPVNPVAKAIAQNRRRTATRSTSPRRARVPTTARRTSKTMQIKIEKMKSLKRKPRKAKRDDWRSVTATWHVKQSV